jgi:antirestriction protein ArdC
MLGDISKSAPASFRLRGHGSKEISPMTTKQDIRQAKHREQVERLESATRELMSEAGFRRYIETRQAFHQYSLNNQLLIAYQQPTVGDEPTAEFATQVAGFNAWKKLDRSVVKGAKGIRILAPMIFKDQDAETGEETKRIWFKAVSVFDVSQTDGAELPDAPERKSIAGHIHADLLTGLEALAAELGVSVDYRDLSDRQMGGWFDPIKDEIVVDDSVSTDEQVRTLTHELAHALGVGYQEFGRERAEVIVEAATTVALESLGFDTSGESLPYIAEWGHREDLASLREDLAKIDELATRIEDAAGVGVEQARELVAV